MKRTLPHTVTVCITALYCVAAMASVAPQAGLFESPSIHHVAEAAKPAARGSSHALLVQVAKVPVLKHISLAPGIPVAGSMPGSIPVTTKLYGYDKAFRVSPVLLSPASGRAPPVHLI